MTRENEEGAQVVSKEQALLDALQRAYRTATAIEPSPEHASRAQVDTLRGLLAEVVDAVDAGLAATAPDERDDARRVIAQVHARCAAVAIAAGDAAAAQAWLGVAAKFAGDNELGREIAAARTHPEAYRQLVLGRNFIARGMERSARKLWAELAQADSPISAMATEELKAPRALEEGQAPSLWRLNGCGVGFYGRRDRWPDGSYATTHCLCALWIPLVPLRAYRVRDAQGGYTVLAREQLSRFARLARLAVLGAAALLIASYAIQSYLHDPDRLARRRLDAVLASAASGDPEEGLRRLTAALDEPELERAGRERAERAGAAVVKLTAGFVARPFPRDSLEQADRLVHRYQALPGLARGGVAHEAVLTVLDGWSKDLGGSPEGAPARLALLRHQAALSESARAAALVPRIVEAQLAVAATKEVDWPLDALTTLVEQPNAQTIARADQIITRLLESPSLLLDAGDDFDAWVAATMSPQKAQAVARRTEALQAYSEVGAAGEGLSGAEAGGPAAMAAESLTGAALAKLASKRPWDQFAVLWLARVDTSSGKLEEAAARLEGLGKPGMMVREARLLLGQVWSAQGKLEPADAILSSLLGARLARYVAASAHLEEVGREAEARLQRKLQAGDVPLDLRQKYDALTDDTQRDELISNWFADSIRADAQVISARNAVTALSDVVPVSLAAGSVRLRRAQAMPEGPARNTMLVEAEHAFLSIRGAAEGQPEFRLGLGEIYARLGKAKESEAEFGALLAKDEPALSLEVASTYRTIGRDERARTVATQVHEHRAATAAQKSHAAVLLGLLAGAVSNEESEAWFRKADQRDLFVRTSLLELEGSRLLRQGKRAECAAKFAQAAAAHLSRASALSSDAYNNAGVAQQSRFVCSGDLTALTESEAAFEHAYRANRDNALVVGNFAKVLQGDGRLRVLGKRLSLRAFQPSGHDVNELMLALLDSPERDAVLADLAANPAVRRGEQLLSEYEVLSTSSPEPFERRMQLAQERRDEAAAAAVVARARAATALDVSQAALTRERWLKGERDAEYLESNSSNLARLEAIADAGKLDAHTRGAVLFLISSTASGLGLYKNDVALLRRAREAAVEAMKLWPALDGNDAIVAGLIDEAGLAADPKAWLAVRRLRSPVAALAKLSADGSPLVATIKASPPWAQVPAFARADATRPGLNDLRLARLLGDAELQARAAPVLDDQLRRLSDELDLILDPADPVAKEDLAALQQR